MGPQGEKGLAPRKHLDGPMPPFQIGWGAQGQVLQQSSVPVRTSEQLPRPPHLTSASLPLPSCASLGWVPRSGNLAPLFPPLTKWGSNTCSAGPPVSATGENVQKRLPGPDQKAAGPSAKAQS